MQLQTNPAFIRYAAAFARLRRGNSRTSSNQAPHKPVMLLSVIDEVAAGGIIGNRIYITPELVARFRDNWSRYVHDPGYSPDFAKPFYHLGGDKFWHIHTLPGREFLLTSSYSPKSFTSLKETVAFVVLDEPLYVLLTDPVSREALRRVLVDTYFPNRAAQEGKGYIAQVAEQILHEAPEQYRQAALAFDQEETVARSAVFKRVIPKVYRYTCCISRMRIEASTINLQMVDACHIVPFAESHDDTIGNGLSLCPNLHRAFDRGLIRIDPDYRVAVSPLIREERNGYGIKGFAGQRILLPAEKLYYPLRENLERHWRRWEGNFG